MPAGFEDEELQRRYDNMSPRRALNPMKWEPGLPMIVGAAEPPTLTKVPLTIL